MSLSKYVRLCLVVMGPLFLAGLITFKFIVPYDKLAYILCEPGSAVRAECRYLGSNEREYDRLKRDYAAWFDISPKEEDELVYLVEGSRRFVNAKIVNATTPFAPDAVIADQLKSLSGMFAVMQLGLEGKETSELFGEQLFLACNGITFDHDSPQFEAWCFGNGWSASVKFIPVGDDALYLNSLKSDVELEIRRSEQDYLLARAILYPLFVYLFLIVSALAWLTARAIRFVRAG